ncbi:MAG: hypothetical protein CBC42_07780 [Betaproteobacteria bacterium TMED82]|nr:MAG: hypothetical protein CBC42_07780 [Betaproteobacteria bacterium TMED82]|tara:strand:+ start:22041 stop:23303 length:1263 start_codon:yes stop_codon:yes gene_type:complete
MIAKKSPIRFITAGSVDDGKSTLIGRLLFDTKFILNDQIKNLESAKNNRANFESFDLSFLTDGLESEREQGITIDVAYRYFNTPTNKFIIADCPGHEQYTRNMVTGASNADIAVILVDASKVKDGSLLEQTRRHTLIISLLKIKTVILAVNKMDLVNFSEALFTEIFDSFQKLLRDLNFFPKCSAIPISALQGDNIISNSKRTKWYESFSFLELLEKSSKSIRINDQLRLPIQYVLRWDGEKHNSQRAYAGRVESGVLSKNRLVKSFPSEISSRIDRIVYLGKEIDSATAGQNVILWLNKDLDISRGDVLIESNDRVVSSKTFLAKIAWLDSLPFNSSSRYILKHNTKEIQAKISIVNKINPVTLKSVSTDTLTINEIGEASVKVSQAILADSFEKFATTGSLILIDKITNQTAAALMIK